VLEGGAGRASEREGLGVNCRDVGVLADEPERHRLPGSAGGRDAAEHVVRGRPPMAARRERNDRRQELHEQQEQWTGWSLPANGFVQESILGESQCGG
jgi:hypothetical protein